MRKDGWYDGGDTSGPSFIIETTSPTGGYAAPIMITPQNHVILNGGTGASGLSYGWVGVGTVSPVANLHVNNSSSLAAIRVSGSGGGLMHFFDSAAPAGQKLYQWRSEGGVFRMSLANDTANAFLQQNILVANSSGNVGLGTASPNERLHVNGGMVVTGAASEQTGVNGLFLGFSGTAASIDAVQQGTDFRALSMSAKSLSFNTWNGSALVLGLYQSNAGNVGVGTSSPAFPLDVVSGSQWAARFRKTDATHGGILVDSAAGYNPNVALSSGGAVKWYMNDNVSNGDSLQFWEATGTNPRLTVTQDGKVGIGTSTPGANLADTTIKLDVQGSINVSGNINAKYQDVAEWVPSTQKLMAGTVVALDSEHARQVIASSKPYDTRVAGVVSSQPGISLGQGGDGKLLVATTGRVKVKVDATRAPIKVGDLLVTSDVEGVAMKSIPVDLGGTQIHRPGTIIGKALEPLEKGKGEILVLLSLQ
jgi:hypothetical protein